MPCCPRWGHPRRRLSWEPFGSAALPNAASFHRPPCPSPMAMGRVPAAAKRLHGPRPPEHRGVSAASVKAVALAGGTAREAHVAPKKKEGFAAQLPWNGGPVTGARAKLQQTIKGRLFLAKRMGDRFWPVAKLGFPWRPLCLRGTAHGNVLRQKNPYWRLQAGLSLRWCSKKQAYRNKKLPVAVRSRGKNREGRKKP